MRQINPPIKIINCIKHFLMPRARVKVHRLCLHSCTHVHLHNTHTHIYTHPSFIFMHHQTRNAFRTQTHTPIIHLHVYASTNTRRLRPTRTPESYISRPSITHIRHDYWSKENKYPDDHLHIYTVDRRNVPKRTCKLFYPGNND